jgi:hypothetical protein
MGLDAGGRYIYKYISLNKFEATKTLVPNSYSQHTMNTLRYYNPKRKPFDKQHPLYKKIQLKHRNHKYENIFYDGMPIYGVYVDNKNSQVFIYSNILDQKAFAQNYYFDIDTEVHEAAETLCFVKKVPYINIYFPGDMILIHVTKNKYIMIHVDVFEFKTIALDTIVNVSGNEYETIASSKQYRYYFTDSDDPTTSHRYSKKRSSTQKRLKGKILHRTSYSSIS